MTQKRTSFAFLMEMLWVCGFFILASCIFVLAFVKANQLSRHASDLSHAVAAVENAVEETFSQYGGPLPDGTETEATLYFDRSWNRLAGSVVPADPSGPADSAIPTGPSVPAGSVVPAAPSDPADPSISAAYRITVHTSWKDRLLTVQADAFSCTKSAGKNQETEALYSLTGARFYPGTLTGSLAESIAGFSTEPLPGTSGRFSQRLSLRRERSHG